MTELSARKRDVSAQLEGVLSVCGLPSKAVSECKALIEMLRAPVCIGLMGLPGGRKRELLAVLADCDWLDPALDWPTLEVSWGDTVETDVFLEDGSILSLQGYPSQAVLDHDPMLVRVRCPEDALIGRRYLLVITDDTAEDILAGLRWASERVDLALWCARAWNGFEHEIWQTGPAALHDHGVLLLTGDPLTALPSGDVFETCYDLRTGDADLLISHIDTVIEEAGAQDVLRAELYLRRYDGLVSKAAQVPVEVGSGPVSDPASDPVSGPVSDPVSGAASDPVSVSVSDQPDAVLTTEPCDPLQGAAVDGRGKKQVPAEAQEELGRLFQHVRSVAEDLRQGVLTGTCAPDQLLETVEEMFEALSDRASDMDPMNEAWPEMGELLFEARDLALLLRMEGDPTQAGDAARLLWQVRHDMERRLAA